MAVHETYCSASNIGISHGQECYMLPLRRSGEFYTYTLATLPILGVYDYGHWVVTKVRDYEFNKLNIELIENYFGITIEEFITVLKYGDYTSNSGKERYKQILKEYKDNYEPSNIIYGKLINNGRLKEICEFEFMFIDKGAYDVFSKRYESTEHYTVSEDDDLRSSMEYFYDKSYLDMTNYKNYTFFSYCCNNDIEFNHVNATLDLYVKHIDTLNKKILKYNFGTTDKELIKERIIKGKNPDISKEVFSDIYFEYEYFNIFNKLLLDVRHIECNMTSTSRSFAPYTNRLGYQFSDHNVQYRLILGVTERLKELSGN